MTDFKFNPDTLNNQQDTPKVKTEGFRFNPSALEPDVNAPLEDALHVNPDDHARNKRLSEKSGLPTALVEQDYKPVENQVKRKEIQNNLSKYKYTANWMAEGDNARLAHDDVEQLGQTENLVRGMGEMVFKVAAGAVSALDTVTKDAAMSLEKRLKLGTFEFTDDGIRYVPSDEFISRVESGERYGMDILKDKLNEVDLGHQEELLTTWEAVKDKPLKNIAPFILQQGLLSTPDMALAIVSLPLSVTSMSGRISEDRAVNEGRDDPTLEDLVKVMPAATASAFLDRLGGRGILGLDDAVKEVGVKELGKTVVKSVAKEGVTEFTQGSLENVGATLGTERGFKLTEMLEQGFQEGLVGGGFGGSVRTVTASAEMANMAVKNSEILGKLNQVQSKLRERSPENYAKFQGKLMKEQGIEQISISGEGFAEYNQSGGDTSWIETLGIAEKGDLEMFEMMEGDVELTPEQYALLPPEVAEQLRKHVRINDGMTEAEAEVYKSEGMQEELNAITESFMQEDSETQYDIQLIQDKIESQLQAIGESPETSSYYGVLMAQRYMTRAQRSGQNPLELYMKDNLAIQQKEQLNQTVDDVTINLDRARSEKSKEDYLKLHKQPIVQTVIKKLGGVDPEGRLAGELRARGVTRKDVPGLFRKGGSTDGDNLVREEVEFFAETAGDADLNNYVSQEELIDAIEREARGEPNYTIDEKQILEDYDLSVENFNRQLSELGLSLEENTDEEIRTAIQNTIFDQSPRESVNITKQDPIFSIPKKELKGKEVKVTDEDGKTHTIKADKAVKIMRQKLNQAAALVDCINAG